MVKVLCLQLAQTFQVNATNIYNFHLIFIFQNYFSVFK